MTNIYRKLKISDSIGLVFNIPKEQFIKNFLNNVSSENHFFLLDILDSANYKYYGKLGSENIRIRKKLKFAPGFFSYGSASGKISGSREITKLNLNIKSFHPIQRLIILLGILFFLFLLYLVFTIENGKSLLIIIVPFFLVFFTYPIYRIRKDLVKFKTELESDLNSFNN
jgi:hypothetical protein